MDCDWKWRSLMSVFVFVIGLSFCARGGAKPAREYLVGGPLAGLKLPLMQGDHGEQPGYPGSVPELIAKGKANNDMGNQYTEWGPQGQAPMVELSPGSDELWRAYMFKYLPIRSFFDAQSQIKSWTAPAIPAEGKLTTEEYEAPLYWVARHGSEGTETGLTWKPRTVVRAKAGHPAFKLPLGKLPIGLYCVRIVGAVEKENIRSFREPVYVVLEVNDQRDGSTSRYRVRITYTADFYSVAEIYFQAPQKRKYTAKLWVDQGSTVPLLVRTVSLDNALAGCDFRAIKTKTMLGPKHPRGTSKLKADERLARDRQIWRAFPHINSQGAGGLSRNPASTHVSFHNANAMWGAEGKPLAEVSKAHGSWTLASPFGRHGFGSLPENANVFLRNEAKGLDYTLDDYHAGKPLPKAFPYRDDGAGLYWPNPEDKNKGTVFCPIASAVDRLRSSWIGSVNKSLANWESKGDADSGRDAAIALIRFAYQFPSIDVANYIPVVASSPGFRSQDSANHKRITEAFYFPHYMGYQGLAKCYDRAFSLVEGNEALAASVRRFVPWVKNSRDLVKLLDTYLLQTVVKRQMRYHYNTGTLNVAEGAAVLGEKKAIEPWMDWLFARSWKYPLSPAGLQDIMIAANDRCGRSYVGSFFYATSAQNDVDAMARFKQMGILPDRYDLSNDALYPKPRASLDWIFSMVVGGYDYQRTGDVNGPEKPPTGQYQRKLKGCVRQGWNATADPRFAWVLKHFKMQNGISEEDWAGIEEAALTVKRAPWLENRSRQVPNWMAALESGVKENDPRLRAAAYVRIGAGMGHHHDDSLDLQVVALGAPMTIDGGQRPSYSTPADRMTRLHNTVEVDGHSHRGESWASTISDAEGARYLRVSAAPPAGATLFQRQTALIETAPGRKDGETVVSPQSYVFDVFRVEGGKTHTYNFHGPIDDELVISSSLSKVEPIVEGTTASADQAYLGIYKSTLDSCKAGDVGKDFKATWRYSRGRKMAGQEKSMAYGYAETDPRRYIRLHMPGSEPLRTLTAKAYCQKLKYEYDVLHLQRRGSADALSTAFGAVIEPYSDKPFIESVTRLPDSLSASAPVSMVVKTLSGRCDLCHAALPGGEVQSVKAGLPGGDVTVDGEYGFLSYEGNRPVQAVISGGTRIEDKNLSLVLDQVEYRGRVTAVDYGTRQLTVDTVWPAIPADQIVELSTPARDGKILRRTSYTLLSAKQKRKGSIFQLKRGADYLRSEVTTVDEAKGIVTCSLKPVLGNLPGKAFSFTASNEARTKFWRADYLGAYQWQLTGSPVTLADFGKEKALRIWEVGTGDSVRLTAWAALKAEGETQWQLTGSSGGRLSLKGKQLETSADGKTWTPVKAKASGGKVEMTWSVTQLPLWVKVK